MKCKHLTNYSTVCGHTLLLLLTFRAQCLCRIFTNLAESFLYHVIHQPGTTLGDMAIMDMLVQCVKHPDYEVCVFCLCVLSGCKYYLFKFFIPLNAYT